MRIFIGDIAAKYDSFKSVVAELGAVKAVFYGLKSGTTDVETAVALFESRDYYVQIDMSSAGVTKPSQSTFIADFPNAIEAYINTASF